MNIKTKLLEEYVNFVDLTKKQNKYFKKLYSRSQLLLFWFYFLFCLNVMMINE